MGRGSRGVGCQPARNAAGWQAAAGHRRVVFRWFAAACIVSLAATSSAQSLVVNGNFNSPSETDDKLSANSGALTGWTVDTGPGGGIQFGTKFGYVSTSSSTQSVELAGSLAQQGGIQQAIATIPGQAYAVSIYAEDQQARAVATGTLSFGGLSMTLSPSSQSWVLSTLTVAATGSSTLLNITGYSSSNVDQLLVDDVSVTPVASAWVGGAAGHATDWGTALNWSPSNAVPGGAGAEVLFGNAGASATVDLGSSNRTVGSLDFVSGTGTTIQSTSGCFLVLDNSGSAAPVTVAGHHAITAGVLLNSDAAVTVTSGTDELTIGGSVADGAATHGIMLSGLGILALGGANTFSGNTTVSSGILLLSNSLALQDSTLTSGGIAFSSSVASHAFTLGGLSGSGNLALADNAGNAVTLSVGNNSSTTTYCGASVAKVP